MTNMWPHIRGLLPRFTLFYRIDMKRCKKIVLIFVGWIANRGAKFVSAKKWMRTCFELLENAYKKSIQRASISTFGYISKTIGPRDALHTLLNNLKVQDWQMRHYTTIAIVFVVETCAPFIVLPALISEYCAPKLNI